MNFSNQLVLWYLQNKRDLPWRATQNPYQIWLSEIILQQTRVSQGLTYYLKFVANFPTVFDLANASEEKVLKLWQGLGYYSRARNLHHSSKYIVHELNGKFPNSYQSLLKLKGVGDYTASAIGSICFNLPTAVVDGNVYRVLSRYFGIHTPINSTEGIKEFKQLAQELIDVTKPGTHNQAVMEFGARMCTPQNPDCKNCPLNNSCIALKEKKWMRLPVKLKKISIKKRYFNYLVIKSENNNTLLQKRENGIWKNLYEFPLIESLTEINEQQLVKYDEFESLFNGIPTLIQLFNQKMVVHKLSHQHIFTKFWIINVPDSSVFNYPWREIKKYPVATLIDNFLNEFKVR